MCPPDSLPPFHLGFLQMILSCLQVLYSCDVISPMNDLATFYRILKPTPGEIKLEKIPWALASWRVSHS